MSDARLVSEGDGQPEKANEPMEKETKLDMDL